MTTGQEARLVGITALLETDGRTITTEGGESFIGLIEDVQELMDPVTIARAKNPVYVTVTALKGAVLDPRKVQMMNEQDYGTMKVLRYTESRGDALTWKWTCEAQRQ